ncbi:MAG: biotin-dependent carboxylase-like uncharacterized protein [Gammaproteobacteria bacterium]|jgi:biotin-dependent carboxylase-like uncharacterized protein
MNGFTVKQPGLLTLIQDRGRYGAHNLGLTTGGPLDKLAFDWANRLLANDVNASCLEISFGGLTLISSIDTNIAITGADMACKLNGDHIEQWRTHTIKKDDLLEFGYATTGVRAYLAVANGFNIAPSFGSSATVVREKIGGLNGDKLQPGDELPCQPSLPVNALSVAETDRPQYTDNVILRVVLGYQHQAFSAIEQLKFFNSDYALTERSDRMGFRLEGETIHTDMVGMLSEGICHGAIQIPADGQPIVLMNDRQTIGGYPKIGSVIPIDTARLAQLSPGSSIRFESISLESAHNIHVLHQSRFRRSLPLAVN